MPLPLPNLDTRRWADLVEEGRALIPRYAPGWTDHNLHDPGIALLDLLAWQVEQTIYRANRIPERHRHKFLQLIGYAPQPPQPARTVLRFTPLDDAASPSLVPIGTSVIAQSASGQAIPFRALTSLMPLVTSLQDVRVSTLGQPSDKQRSEPMEWHDFTGAWRDGRAFPLFGEDPAVNDGTDPSRQPAFYLGFDMGADDKTLPPDTTVTLWFQMVGPHTDQRERMRIVQEAFDAVATRRCPRSRHEETTIGPAETLLSHHGLRTVWEYFNGTDWATLDSAQEAVVDETRGFTLSGAVRIKLPTEMACYAGDSGLNEKLFYLRCRLAEGRPDSPPQVEQIVVNAVPVEQSVTLGRDDVIAVGVDLLSAGTLVVGQRIRAHLVRNEQGELTQLLPTNEPSLPELVVAEYQPATAQTTGRLVMGVAVDRGTGYPQQTITLPAAPVAYGELALWTVHLNPNGNGGNVSATVQRWQLRPDFDASTRRDAHFVLNATSGEIHFGDGERGQVVPADDLIVAHYAATVAAAGNVAAGTRWTYAAPTGESHYQIENQIPATAGAEGETLDEASGRAADNLWAHERLLELCDDTNATTLDQLARSSVLSRPAPTQATTLLDYERLALETPGAYLARAHAWAGIDPLYPGLQAPGTVTVVIVPALPKAAPEPTPGLIQAVRCYLERRRTVGTRLVVVGPQYVQVRVETRVRLKTGADPQSASMEIMSAMDRFLDPLRGGPGGHGWPFGRNVYRSELLQLIDSVPGVAHVLELRVGQYLFGVDSTEVDFVHELDMGTLSQTLCSRFQEQGITLSTKDNVINVIVEEAGRKWSIVAGDATYFARHEEQNPWLEIYLDEACGNLCIGATWLVRSHNHEITVD